MKYLVEKLPCLGRPDPRHPGQQVDGHGGVVGSDLVELGQLARVDNLVQFLPNFSADTGKFFRLVPRLNPGRMFC